METRQTAFQLFIFTEETFFFFLKMVVILWKLIKLKYIFKMAQSMYNK